MLSVDPRLNPPMPDNGGKYSLEELLRAKRHERPTPEFWASFDRELKSKQRLLIQKQLVHETRRKSPALPIFRFGAIAATLGAAAFAVYIGFNTDSAPTAASVVTAEAPTPSFTVGTSESIGAVVRRPVALQEFATLAQPARPRVVVLRAEPAPANQPTPSQLSALETLAQLEKEIRANREANSNPQVAFNFPGVNALFEDAEIALANEKPPASDAWNFEQPHYLLGKYANPLGGSLNPSDDPLRSRTSVESVSFSQLDEVLSSRGVRRSDKSMDALTVRF